MATFDLVFWQYLFGSWLLAGCLVLMVRGFAHQPWHRALGIGIMSVPLWTTLLGILESIAPLLAGGVVLRAYSEYQLSTIYSRSFLTDFGYLGVGFMTFSSGGRWGGITRIRDIARRLVEAGLPMGGRSEGDGIRLAWLWFPVLLFGAVLVSVLASRSEGLTSGDETQVFASMTPYHALLIAMAAGFGEELLYRGFLQTALSRVMPVWAAVGAQAVFFAFAHAGYGNWAHVLSPFLFGIATGIIALRFGIWAAITLHVLIDVYAFGAYAGEDSPWFASLLFLALVVNAAFLVISGIVWLYRRITRGRNGPSARAGGAPFG